MNEQGERVRTELLTAGISFDCPLKRRDSQALGPVLIAEDDRISARVLCKVLESVGHKVEHVMSGDAALERYRSGSYRIVISDWMMPALTGIELCKAIRKLGRPYTYFILLTSRGEKADRFHAFEAGVDDMLAKPLERDELMSRLKAAYRILAMEDKLQAQKSELEFTGAKLVLANKNLSVASRRFEKLFQSLPVPCFTFDRGGFVQEWNLAAEELFGIAAYVAFQKPVSEVLALGKSNRWRSDKVKKVLAGKEIEGFEWRFRRRDGAELFLVCTMFPLHGPTGETLGAISAHVDITYRKRAERRIADQMQEINRFARSLEAQKNELEALNAKLERLAITDGLTGLRNFRSFHEELGKAIEDAQRTGTPLSLIIADVDHFKQYNDTYGHLAGDDVLKEVASQLRAASGDRALVARYGGEEFAILLVGANKSEALETAETIRCRVAAHPWSPTPITVSLGVATSEFGELSLQGLIASADAALYYSKQSGRNRATHKDDVPHLAAPGRKKSEPAANAA